MARIDDYIAAKKIAVEKLSGQNLDDIARRAGFETKDTNSLRIPFLDRVYRASYPDFTFEDENDTEAEVPIQEQVIILHYLMAESFSTDSEKWIAYREIPGAAFYFSAFVKRAADPLKKVFGADPKGFARACGLLAGAPIETGDAGCEIRVFPNVPIRLIIWQGDEEFPPEATVLFDESIGKMLSPEDVAWLAGMLVYRLIALSR